MSERVAALFDIHGNVPALDAVLAEVHAANVDLIVVGGDVVPGPMPREALERLLSLETPVQFIHGNGERAVLAQLAAGESGTPTYWGTTSGAPPQEPTLSRVRWSARQVAAREAHLSQWPRTLRLEVAGIGVVVFCHSTPRSETEVFFRRTPEDVMRPIFDGLGAALAVCGHTHMQFDRRIGATRVVNAGSVGMPFGDTGAFWALLGPGVELKRTPYDLARAAETIRGTAYPAAGEVANMLQHPPSEAEILELFRAVELK